MENKRPTGHGKKVGSGSAHVEKGEKVTDHLQMTFGTAKFMGTVGIWFL